MEAAAHTQSVLSLDRAAGRRGRKTAKDRQSGDQREDRSLLQRRKARFRPGLAVGVYDSVFVPQINSLREFMKRGFAAQLDHGIRANDRWYQDIE